MLVVSHCQVIRRTEYKSRQDSWSIHTLEDLPTLQSTTQKTGMNTNHNLLLKQIIPVSYGTLQYTQMEKLMLINQILPLNIAKTTHVY